jgi:hypothetical protein
MSQEEDLVAAAMLSAVAGYPPQKFAAQAAYERPAFSAARERLARQLIHLLQLGRKEHGLARTGRARPCSV